MTPRDEFAEALLLVLAPGKQAANPKGFSDFNDLATRSVLGQVTRAGTAGEVLAPIVVDRLITEAAATRQRGLAGLADTGRQIEVSLRLPVLTATGVIDV